MSERSRGQLREGARSSRVAARPAVGVAVGVGQLGQREGLPDLLAQLVDHELELADERPVADGVAALRLETAVAFVPFLADQGQCVDGHGPRL